MSFTKDKDSRHVLMFSYDFSDVSIIYMIELLSPRLYGTVCTHVRFCCWHWVYSVTTMLSWVLGRLHYDKDDGSVGWASLHRRTCKRFLYWVCPTQSRFVTLVKIFWYTWYVLLDFNDVYTEYLRKLFSLLFEETILTIICLCSQLV